MIKQKVHLLLENLDQLRNVNIDFVYKNAWAYNVFWAYKLMTKTKARGLNIVGI